MQVDFYRSNEQNAPTVENYLFTKELSQVMNGEYIEHGGQYYQVTGQTIAEKKGDPHNVFIYPVQRKPIEIKLEP